MTLISLANGERHHLTILLRRIAVASYLSSQRHAWSSLSWVWATCFNGRRDSSRLISYYKFTLLSTLQLLLNLRYSRTNGWPNLPMDCATNHAS